MKKSTMIFVIILCLVALVSIYANRPLTEEEYKRIRFENCINDYPSDAVCDSCYNMYMK